MTEGFAGTGSLVWLALRRDRVLLPAWIALFVVMAGFSADATIGLYPDTAARVQAAEALNGTPSLVALYGRVYDVTSLGAIAMIKMGGLGSAMLAVFAFMIVIRHTRVEEESGRLELLAGGVVGPYAPLVAALACAVGGALAVGVLTAGALAAVGLPFSGSLAFGLAWTATGTAFAGLGAVAAQVTVSARVARGLATAALGLAYVLRAIGDTSSADEPSWVSWSSPIGWGQQVRPYAGDRWQVFVLLVAFAGATSAVAFALRRRRDLGAGLIADRGGPAGASAGLGSPLGLAWRLQRGSLLAWTAGFLLLGFVLGNSASNIGGMLRSTQAREMITRLGGVQGLTDAFLATELGIVGVLVTVFGVQAALHLHSEETSLRLESVLATAAGRTEWVMSHTLVALAGTTFLLLGTGLSVGLAHASQTGEPGDVAPVVAGALVQIPAAWVLVGLVVAVYGFLPRLASAAWVALVAFLLIGELGPLLQLPAWVMDLSPFSHVPRMPGSDVHLAPLLWLTCVAAALVVAGLAGFRRRDVGTS